MGRLWNGGATGCLALNGQDETRRSARGPCVHHDRLIVSWCAGLGIVLMSRPPPKTKKKAYSFNLMSRRQWDQCNASQGKGLGFADLLG